MKIESTLQSITQQTFNPALTMSMPPFEGEDLVPQMVLKERYIITKLIGQGGIGQVYLAQDLQLVLRPVVVKVLQRRLDDREWALSKFQHEIEALSRIYHPGVVPVLDAGCLPNGEPFFVMPYVKGVQLRQLIPPQGMVVERAADIMMKICQALEAAHKEGVIHRDLKPENIMVETDNDGTDWVKVIDFGVAKVKDSQLAPQAVTAVLNGTALYMSPEQLTMRPVYETSDIYALGIIAYEMLTGRHPFNPESTPQLLELQKAGVRVKATDLRPKLSPAVNTVLSRALDYDRRRRYESALDFGNALKKGILVPHIAPETEYLPDLRPERVPGHQLAEEVPRPVAPRTGRAVAAIGVLLALIFLALGMIGVMLWTRLLPPAAPNALQSKPGTAPAAEMRYWLTVTPPKGAETVASEEDALETGWRFRLHARSTQSGFFYAIYESEDGKFLPLAVTEKGETAANREIVTAQYEMTGQAGMEKFWLVWSAQPIADLQKARRFTQPQDRATIKKDAELQGLLGNALAVAGSPADVKPDEVSKETLITARHGAVAHKVVVIHRQK